ncbi:MAG: DUF362 domain-containing protein [Proteobacteria bacterium]|nr:DUF362 domain-containing protein [Pseudomonadota bacterium]
MSENTKLITRRDFIRTGSCAMAGGFMGLPLLSEAIAKTAEKSRVVLIRDERVFQGSGSFDQGIMEKMLDQAVTNLLGVQSPAEAWRRLVKREDVVGVKSNVWGPLPTPPGLEDTIVSRLTEAGVQQQNIAVDDRGVREDPVFRKCTALINIRPMRTHHWSGLGTLLKNYIMFVPSPYTYHGNSCERLGAIWNEPHLKGKTRLNILVMLTPLFHGVGPHHYSGKYIWPYGGLIISRDPVAADATGARVIQAKRNQYFKKDTPISPRPLHIEAADVKFGIGNSHPDRINLIRIGWETDMLI